MSRGKLKWAAFGLALGIIGGGIGAAAANRWYTGTTRFETIQAEKIVIVNKAGEVVAALTVDSNGGGLLGVSNKTGEPVAALGVHPGGGGILEIYNAAGNLVAGLP